MRTGGGPKEQLLREAFGRLPDAFTAEAADREELS